MEGDKLKELILKFLSFCGIIRLRKEVNFMNVKYKLSSDEIKKRLENIKKNPRQKDDVDFKFTSEQIQNAWRKVISSNGKSK